MPNTTGQQLSAIERKLQNRNGVVTVKRAKSFNSSSLPNSPSTFRRKKAPTVEPRYTKATYLLIEAKKLARELEEKKKKGTLFPKPNSIKTISLGQRSRSGSGSSFGKRFRRPNASSESSSRSNSPPLEKPRRRISYMDIQTRNPTQEVSAFEGRMTPLRNSGRRKNFMVSPIGKTCDECEKPLTSGFYSEHHGLSYCNVPCYTNLFSSLYSRPNDFDSCSTLSEEQKTLRGSLIPKLRTYNTYYSEKPCQISCREMNDRFVLEGVIKVYWGLQHPVTLADSCHSHYQLNFLAKTNNHDHSKTNGENNENVPPSTDKKISIKRRPKSAAVTSQVRYSYKGKSDGARKRATCYACNYHSENGKNSTSFIPPKGCPTTLRLTNHVTAPVVIDMLLKKFQIKDDRKRFTLFTVYESGGQKRLSDKSYPLLSRLNLGPCEDVAKIYIMDAADQIDISLEVAQYINFSSPVLETFVQKFHEEEEREVERIKEKYADYRELLLKRMSEFEKNNFHITMI